MNQPTNHTVQSINNQSIINQSINKLVPCTKIIGGDIVYFISLWLIQGNICLKTGKVHENNECCKARVIFVDFSLLRTILTTSCRNKLYNNYFISCFSTRLLRNIFRYFMVTTSENTNLTFLCFS